MTTAYTRSRRASAARSLDGIQVREAMHRGVITCDPHAPLPTVARTMAAHRIHSVVVQIDAQPGSWGIVSDLDLVAAARSDDFDERTAQEIAASCRLTIGCEESLDEAARLLHEYDEAHLIVLGRATVMPVGVLSTLDIVDVLADLPGGDEHGSSL